MKRQLVSSAEARPATSQHTKPCADCPWSRKSINGWLGGMSKEEWIQAAHSDARIDCHTLTGVQCAGAAIYRSNTCKLAPNTLKLPPDAKRVFEKRSQFLEHHSKMPARLVGKERKRMPKNEESLETQFDRIVQEAISEAEGVKCSMRQFAEGLEQMIDELRTRLSIAQSEIKDDE